MTIWVWIIGITILVGILVASVYFFGGAWLAAYYEVNNRPKEPMLWCWKHGMFRKKHAIDLGYSQYCPTCYKAALDQADQVN